MLNYKLVDIDSVRPSTYNPRSADPKRLDQIELSLTKLGFLMPIFADSNGEILSGHQRHYVAKRMGLKKIPVEFTKEMSLEERKSINIVFNRATNDFSRDGTAGKVTELLNTYDIVEMAKELPDKDITSNEVFPCMNYEIMETRPLVEKNIQDFVVYSKRLARSLNVKGVVMPIIINEDDKVINGIGRLEMLAELGRKKALVVRITNAEADFTYAMLNLLSMEFDIHNRYRDELRYNSFRNPFTTRIGIGGGFTASLYGNKTGKSIGKLEGLEDEWKAHYGNTVLDFGTGHLTDTIILEDIGVRVSSFEPFLIEPGKGHINPDRARKLTREFLKDVASGLKYDTIFISSVFNSVPYREDREKIITLVSALSSRKTKLNVFTMGTKAGGHTHLYTDGYDEKAAGQIGFLLDYEENIVIGNVSKNPKVQKFHTAKELYEVVKTGFKNVNVKNIGGTMLAVANNPNYTKQDLVEAIEFEFDLPYPDGTRMGLVKEAKKAFSERLGIEL